MTNPCDEVWREITIRPPPAVWSGHRSLMCTSDTLLLLQAPGCGEPWQPVDGHPVPNPQYLPPWSAPLPAGSVAVCCATLTSRLVVPGIGSIVAGFLGSKTSTIIIGVIQLLTAWIVLGNTSPIVPEHPICDVWY
eukprot:94529-Rhodomonas_salina.1